MKVGVENYRRFNGMKIPSMKEKKGASELWSWHEFAKPALARKHYITETQKVIRGSPLLSPSWKIQQWNASIFLAVLLCFAEIFRESCVEKYKKFNGVDFSSMRARTKVLASFESQWFMLRAVAHKHYVIETQKPIRRSKLACAKSLIESRPKIDFYGFS